MSAKLSVLASLLFLFIVCTAQAAPKEIHWYNNFNQGAKVARETGKPLLLDFQAEWCGPCKMIAPILDDVSKEYGDRLQIAKMNVDDNREVPAKFGIRGIPTLMLFKGGNIEATKVGALSKSQLTAFIDSHL